jgi:hypothetical protein
VLVNVSSVERKLGEDAVPASKCWKTGDCWR